MPSLAWRGEENRGDHQAVKTEAVKDALAAVGIEGMTLSKFAVAFAGQKHSDFISVIPSMPTGERVFTASVLNG